MAFTVVQSRWRLRTEEGGGLPGSQPSTGRGPVGDQQPSLALLGAGAEQLTFGGTSSIPAPAPTGWPIPHQPQDHLGGQPANRGAGGIAHVGISIGIAIGHGASMSSDAMVRDADPAMYQAKESGKNCYHASSSPAIAPLESSTHNEPLHS
jgi:hypothetical protein